MLRSRRDEYTAALGSSCVRLIRRRHGSKQEVVGHTVLTDRHDRDPKNYVAAFEELLAEHPAVRRIALVLRDDTVAYARVPWTDAILGPDEFQDLCTIRLNELHGRRVAGWTVHGWQEYGRNGLACAAPADIIKGVEQVCEQRGVMLYSILPALSDVLAAARIARANRCWLAVDVTPDGCLFAAHVASGWNHVRFVRHTDVSRADVSSLIARECFVLGADDAFQIFVHDDGGVRQFELSSLLGMLQNA